MELEQGWYLIRAEGFWRGIWGCGIEQVTEKMEHGAVWGLEENIFRSKSVEILVRNRA